MAEYSYSLKIPKERIAVLIGVKGSIKKQIEEFSKTRMVIDSKEGDVTLKGDDSVNLYTTKEVVFAISRGFNPELAQLLFKQDYALEIINMLDFAHNKNDLPRVKGRVIGTEGKSRKTIEELSECYISVYGKTIALIGQMEYVPNAKRAIEMLLEGSSHSNVFRWLENKRRLLKRMKVLDNVKKEDI